MTTFSIITVTYNAEKCLRLTLRSVLAQTYRGIEHIIVDGASKDGTPAMAEEYRKESKAAMSGHKVIIRSEPDRGIYDAMNKGLAMATGDYVCFLNAGDSLPKANTIEMIANATQWYQRHEGALPAILYGDTDIVDSDGFYLRPRRHRPPEQLTWRSFRNGMLVCHQAFYARTDIARGVSYDLRFKYSADVDWCIRVMKEAERQGGKTANLHATVACYMEEGQTTRHHSESLRERFRVMCRHYGWFTTVGRHLWFVVRSVINRRKSSKRESPLPPSPVG